MDQYVGFRIEERNGDPHDGGPQFRLRASGKLNDQHPLHASSLLAAKEAVRERLTARLAQAEREVAGWKRQLAELDSRYLTPQKPQDWISGHWQEIVQHLASYRESGAMGLFKFGGLQMQTGYLGRNPELVVFHVPDFAEVSFPFLNKDIEDLLKAFEAAGFEGPFSRWNGAGHYTWSLQLSSHQVPGAAKVEPVPA